jgi:hypothetical protein
MPNISETSASDISLSPAWSVMIIFLFVERGQVAFWARPRQPGDLSELAEPFGQAARSDPRPVADWRPSKT